MNRVLEWVRAEDGLLYDPVRIEAADALETLKKLCEGYRRVTAEVIDERKAVQKQLDEARAELAKLETDLDSARHELEWEACERMKACDDRDSLRAAIEAHNARITLGTQHMVIPLPPAADESHDE